MKGKIAEYKRLLLEILIYLDGKPYLNDQEHKLHMKIILTLGTDA